MITNNFNGFSIRYYQEVTEENYSKIRIEFISDKCDYIIRLQSYFFNYYMAKALTSNVEDIVLDALSEYKYSLDLHLSEIKPFTRF